MRGYLPAGCSAEWDDLRAQVVRMPLAEVARMAAERWGTDAAAFRFERMDPVSAEMSTYWRNTVSYLHQAFTGPHPVTLRQRTPPP